MNKQMRRGVIFRCNEDDNKLMPLYVACFGAFDNGRAWLTGRRVRPQYDIYRSARLGE